MPLISLILVLAVIGFCLYLVMQIPMPELFKNAIIVIVVIALVLWLLQIVGVVGPTVPRLH